MDRLVPGRALCIAVVGALLVASLGNAGAGGRVGKMARGGLACLRRRLRLKGVLAVLVMVGLAGPLAPPSIAQADVLIEYSLSGGWSYQEYPGTLSLSANPSGGIIASIDVPTGIDEGGLIASRHALPGFSLGNVGFIQLEYGDFSSTITGSTAGVGLVLEVEFYDTSLVWHEMAVGIWRENESTSFETWFGSDDGLGYYGDYFETPIPDGLAVHEGALGLYTDGLQVLPYFKDGSGGVQFPFSAWDISGISGMHDFSVDNDFEAFTEDGGAVVASVNLKQVVYGVPEPVALSLLAVGALALIRRRYTT